MRVTSGVWESESVFVHGSGLALENLAMRKQPRRLLKLKSMLGRQVVRLRYRRELVRRFSPAALFRFVME